jgi:ketosteroid isomerase-like protein
MSADRIERGRRGFDLWSLASNDADELTRGAALRELVEMYHPDAEMDCSRTLPDFPVMSARAAMISWVEGSREAYSSVLYEPTAVVEGDDDDVLIVAARVTARGALSGAPMQADFAYLFRYDGDLIVSATTFLSLQDALDAASPAD